NRRVLPHAREVDELQIDELDAVLFGKLEHFFRFHEPPFFFLDASPRFTRVRPAVRPSCKIPKRYLRSAADLRTLITREHRHPREHSSQLAAPESPAALLHVAYRARSEQEAFGWANQGVWGGAAALPPPSREDIARPSRRPASHKPLNSVLTAFTRP